jgi:hypothetical protein
MVNTNYKSSFPDQVVPNEEKQTLDYGLQVARAIENEWFRNNRGGDRFTSNFQEYHRRRLYARGEQSIQKYKDELSINGDLSYLNLDWKPVPVIPKFVDIVVNGMSQRNYEIKAYAQDPIAKQKKTRYAETVMSDMFNRQSLTQLTQETGINFFSVPDPENLPKDQDEFEVYMQLNYKEAVEIALEELINNSLDKNKYDEVRKRFIYDLVVCGIGAAKTEYNKSNGLRVKYVDPANLVYSYTEDPNFDDLYYIGEVKQVSLSEIAKLFPYLTPEDLIEIQKYPGNNDYVRNYYGQNDNNTISVMFFEYKTFEKQVFKIKETEQGLQKALEKPDTFNPPTNDNFERVERTIEVLYTGAKILGHEKMLSWKMAENMTRPYADSPKVEMNYTLVAPRMYRGRVESLVSRITGFADMIQLTHLKLQQVMSRMVPDGVYVDVDGLAEVDLGNGTNYNPAEALNMYFQTGSIVGRSFTQEGDMNPGKVPIQELQTSSGQGKIGSLINTYQYYLQMIRDVTGLNEARDGSQPDKNALVGLQKLAAANSNTATRHILQAASYITLRLCENISLKAKDIFEFALTEESLEQSINDFNVSTLKEISNLHLHDFGIYLQLEPDVEEKQSLESNIQAALQSGSIYLDDAIEIRNINNIDLANKYLRIKRQKKQEADQAAQQQTIQAQGQANAQASEAAALAELQKQQALTESKLQLEQGKSQFEIQKLEREAAIKMRLMELEFQFNKQLAQAQAEALKNKDAYKEDRKDERTKIQATQQSELIDQRKNDTLPKNFESAGFDVLGGFDLGQFDPK